MRKKFNIGILAAIVLFLIAIYSFFQLDFIAGFMFIFTSCAFGIIFGED